MKNTKPKHIVIYTHVSIIQVKINKSIIMIIIKRGEPLMLHTVQIICIPETYLRLVFTSQIFSHNRVQPVTFTGYTKAREYASNPVLLNNILKPEKISS